MSGPHPLHRVAIAGVAATEMARQLDTTSAEISLRAARAALDDAGLTMADVDGVAARWPGPGGTVFQPGSADWAEVFGQPLRWVCDTYPQGVPGLLDAAGAGALLLQGQFHGSFLINVNFLQWRRCHRLLVM